IFVLVLPALIFFFFFDRTEPAPKPQKEATKSSESGIPAETVAVNLHQSEEFRARETIGYWPNLSGVYFNSTSTETGLQAVDPAQTPCDWSVEIGSGYSTPVLGLETTFVFYRQGDEEILDCRKLMNGELVWQFRSPTSYACPVEYSSGPYSTPALSEKYVYALGTEAKLYCIDRQMGELIWIRDLQADYAPEDWDFPVGSSPLVVEGTVYLNLGGTKGESTIVAIDAESSRTRWTSLSDGRSYASPRLVTISGIRHLITLTDRYLSSLDPDTGIIRWQEEFGVKKSPNRVNAVSPLIVDNQIIVTAGPGAGIACYTIAEDGTQKLAWSDPRHLDSQFSNITCLSDTIFGFTSKWNRQAELRRLSRQTGEIEWSWNSVLMRGSLAVADGKLFLLGEEGHFAILDISRSEPIVLVQPEQPVLKGPCYSSPVIGGGYLVLRNEEVMKAWNLRGGK
ncbi:MAG: PQQ-like beta-propeller repeat protein, partial [Planctomycetaceae bacterium]|nr:PQQ-like beta-propeller repeat protein [Planctomycetaceae bacterium]